MSAKVIVSGGGGPTNPTAEGEVGIQSIRKIGNTQVKYKYKKQYSETEIESMYIYLDLAGQNRHRPLFYYEKSTRKSCAGKSCFRADLFQSSLTDRQTDRQTAADMAEYSQAGLLAALLFFTALTVRDIYLGRSSPQRGQQPADSPGLSPDTLPDTDPGKQTKSTVYSGPLLKFQYW